MPLDLGTGTVHPDLTCRERCLVIEADSWTYHAKRKAHDRDCARYNLLVIRGCYAADLVMPNAPDSEAAGGVG